MNDPALLELFTRLREAGLPLGLAEYHLLLQSMQAGFGTCDRTALAQLCCALWVKSERDQQIFQDYFDQIVPNQPEPVFSPNETENDSSKNYPEGQPILRRRVTSRIPRLLLLGLATCAMAISSTFLRGPQIPPLVKDETGSLAFSSVLFFPPVFVASESDRAASIKITRTGGDRGKVSATLVIEDDLLNPGTINKTSQVIEFAHEEGGEKIIQISIIDNDTAESDRTITLRLTEPKDGVKIGTRNTAPLAIKDDDGGILGEQKFLIDLFHLLLIVIVSTILLFVVWKIWRNRQTGVFRDEPAFPDTYGNLPKTVLSPKVIRAMADEIQAAKAIRQSDNQPDEFPFIVNDLPVTHRQMKQGWRYLRQFTREGVPSELDLEATIQQVVGQGTLLNPVLVPPRKNRVELLLLIDQDGSMVPFHHLSQGLVDTAFGGGRFSRVRVYYFHNCPDEYLYHDQYHVKAEPIDDCLANLPRARTVCLIFSDAGAARGGFSSKRRRLTKFFLKQLSPHVRYVTWLNPVPRKRWETTTAQDIAALVPMFEVNRQEFYHAIDALRGRHQSLEGRLR